MRPATTVRSAVECGEERCSAVEGNTARSACLPTSREPISLSSPRAGAPSIVSMRSASSPPSPAAVASGQRVTSPVLTTESVPRPTRNPARRNAANGAAPCPWARFERGQCATATPASRRVSMSGPSTWTQWMHSHPVARSKAPSRKRYCTGEQCCACTAMPRERSASANEPLPSRTSCVSSRDSARCTATGRSEEHTSELQSQSNLVCRLLLEKKKTQQDCRSSRRRSTCEHRFHRRCCRECTPLPYPHKRHGGQIRKPLSPRSLAMHPSSCLKL